MVFNITFINISSWWSVLFVEETVENHLPAKSLTNFMKLLQCCIEYTSQCSHSTHGILDLGF
jgi:hypothetical protein